MKFSELLSDLGMETHLDLSAAAQAGGCTIQFDKDLEVVLEEDTETGAAQIMSEVAHVPKTDREQFFAALLQLHVFGLATDGGVFGFDPQHDRILFFKTLDLVRMDPPEAIQQIETFVNQAQRWRDHLPAAIPNLTSQSTDNVDFPHQRV